MKIFLKFALFCCVGACASAFAQSVYYLDCGGGNDRHDGLSPQSAWKTLETVNSHNFLPGDALLAKRGTTCTGMLWPKGSGMEGKPIRLGAFGVGALPRIVGTGNPAGLKLDNQQYWEIADLEVTGGDPYGIDIGGSLPRLVHFRITDVVVHDVTGQPKTKQNGLVVIAQDEKAQTVFDDIVIDGVTAYNTTQWAGILISGASYSPHPDSPRGSNVIMRNCVVHDVAGDGILVLESKHVLIERNVAWDTGLQYTETIGTPDGIWEWMCQDCKVQYNEGFFSDSPGVDGGVFDIDYGNIDNIVQYNFAHDSQGYCVSVFGADGVNGTSRNSIVRRNLCLNNGRSPRLAQRQGAIYLSTWNGGWLSGVQIYNNTVVWDPPIDTAVVVNEADIDAGAPHIFSNNLIVSRVPTLTRTNSALEFSDNQYWVLGNVAPRWTTSEKDFQSLRALQATTGQEQRSTYLDPNLGLYLEPAATPRGCNPPSAQTGDLYGRTVAEGISTPGAIAPFPLAHQPGRPLGALPLIADGKAYALHGWTLLALLAPEGHAGFDASRSQLVVLQSMLQQFSALGLHVAVAPTARLEDEAAVNWSKDWNLGEIQLLANIDPAAAHRELGLSAPIGTLLISPAGKVVHIWNGLVAAPEVELTLRALLGTPVGMQTLTEGTQIQGKR
jgi:hypothetical protein